MKRYLVALRGVVLAFFFRNVVFVIGAIVADVFHDVSSMGSELRRLGGAGQCGR